MNRVELIGRLTNDPDIRTTQSGSSIAKFTLAVRSDYKDNAGNYQTDFIPCVAFRGAENIQKYLKKGYKCAVAGRIKTGSYTNDSGQKVYTTDVIADTVEFLESRQSQQQNQQPAQYQQPQQYGYGAPEPSQMGLNDMPDWNDYNPWEGV